MTDQAREIHAILNERITLIQAIAQTNCEVLRLNQIASGMMFLDQKDEDDGAETDQRGAERDANETALIRCASRIEGLEAKLADLDRELTTATERKEK